MFQCRQPSRLSPQQLSLLMTKHQPGGFRCEIHPAKLHIVDWLHLDINKPFIRPSEPMVGELDRAFSVSVALSRSLSGPASVIV